MIVTFDRTYLQELYTDGQASDKHHRFQPQIVSKYVKQVCEGGEPDEATGERARTHPLRLAALRETSW